MKMLTFNQLPINHTDTGLVHGARRGAVYGVQLLDQSIGRRIQFYADPAAQPRNVADKCS